MAKQPKKTANKSSGTPPSTGQKANVPDQVVGKTESVASNMVRLKPVFQKRLKRVAESKGMKVGEFIEHQLGEMVNREFREIVERELAELREQDGE
ncbi:hypothetical protein [Gemmata obscuriglobus]|uniref:hypothetical protein n=1 Tax=Gemmata obscuriglobus TaxID=114 RepID=UPI0011CE9EB7|nr:hypothetical protein [Gemmata obscuriglobus]